MKKWARELFNRAVNHPRSSAIAVVGAIGLAAGLAGVDLNAANKEQLIGGIAVAITIIANLLSRDAPRIVNGNGYAAEPDRVSGDWKAPKDGGVI